MVSNEPVFLPAKREANRQACTVIAIVGAVGCLLFLLFGVWVWSIIPEDFYACTGLFSWNANLSEYGKIAFVSDRDGNPEIYVMDTNSSSVTRLTDNPAGDYAPAWSPDGKRIAFYSERDGNAEIYVINVDGAGLTRLTSNPANDYNPAWSPDGKYIAFHSHRYLGAGRIFVMNADGSEVTRLTEPEWDDWSPIWSPDGTQILFNSSRFNNRDIWLMNADGSKLTNLTRNPADDWWPDWSPDGTHIAFHSARDGNFEIYTMNADGSGVARLTDHPASDYDPAWSTDGSHIAFATDRCGDREIFAVETDGSGVVNLTRHSANDWAPAWQPVGAFNSMQVVIDLETPDIVEETLPAVEPAKPGVNLALEKQVKVSRALTSNPAKMAVDGNLDNWWGAGAFAPQWIEIDLGANYVVGEIKLLPSQSPSGKTIHRLLIMGLASRDEYVLVETLNGLTEDNKWITFKFPEPMEGVRYVRIETVSSPSWISWREVRVIAGE